MNFLLPEELVDFSESLGKFFTGAVPSSLLRSQMMEDGPAAFAEQQQNLWNSLAELGALLASVPEEFDGLGFGSLASNVILHHAGKSLIPVPLFESIALGIVPIIELASAETKSELLALVGSGELKISGAFHELFSGADLPKAVKDGENYLLSGTCSLVPSASWVNSIVVPASVDGLSTQLFLVETSAVELRAQDTLDVLRPYHEVTFNNSSSTALTEQAIDASKLERVKQIISVLAASELIGACEQAVAMTVEHCTTRKQFGKPIASFQAVSHKISDMHADTEAAKSLVRFAAYSAANDPEQLPSAAAAAKALASDLGPKVIERAIQAHGGIGFTYEYDLHLFLRRVRCLSALYGSSNELYAELGSAALS